MCVCTSVHACVSSHVLLIPVRPEDNLGCCLEKHGHLLFGTVFLIGLLAH